MKLEKKEYKLYELSLILEKQEVINIFKLNYKYTIETNDFEEKVKNQELSNSFKNLNSLIKNYLLKQKVEFENNHENYKYYKFIIKTQNKNKVEEISNFLENMLQKNNLNKFLIKEEEFKRKNISLKEEHIKEMTNYFIDYLKKNELYNNISNKLKIKKNELNNKV